MSRTERQKEVVRRWISNKCNGICVAPTGFGKTAIAILALKAFFDKNKKGKAIVVVPTENLKNQWINSLKKEGLNNVGVQIINSAIKKSERIDLLILDEVHRYLSDNFVKVFKVKHPKMILGLSATFNRLDGKHLLLEDYCPVVDRISIKEALENNWLANYREYKVMIEPDDIHVYNEYSKSFQEAFSVFNYDFDFAMKCVTNIPYRRTVAKSMGISSKDMDAVAYSWIRNLRKRKDYIINHPQKLVLTRKILDARPFSKAATFSGTIKMAERIGRGITIHSKKSKKNNLELLEEFKKAPYGVINSSKSINEGVDIPGLNLEVILYNSSSPTEKTQKLGRSLRVEGDKISEVFTLVLQGTVEEKWFENSSQFSEYIEVSEEELEDILLYKPLNRESYDGKEVDKLFRT